MAFAAGAFAAVALTTRAAFGGAAAGVCPAAAIGTARAETRTSRARRGEDDERII
jgi:hypothetical protein